MPLDVESMPNVGTVAITPTCPAARHMANGLWRVKLCRVGPACDLADCIHAHSLSELLPPDERYVSSVQAWAEGVDRWYGQQMTSEQLHIIDYYRQVTPIYDLPVWVHGLRFATEPCLTLYLCDEYMTWDYGLSHDLQMLCRCRTGSLPFLFMPLLWGKLSQRRQLLQCRHRTAPDQE